VIIIEPSARRAELARELGAELHLDPAAGDLGEQMAAATSGRLADVVIEASGNPAAMAATLQVAGFGARLVNVGIDVGRSAPAQLGLIQSKQLQIRGTIGSPGVWPRTLRFLERTGIDLSPLVTSTVALQDAAGAVARARTDRSEIKVHLVVAAR
jgi:L-iditol 2-dehydrogenase